MTSKPNQFSTLPVSGYSSPPRQRICFALPGQNDVLSRHSPTAVFRDLVLLFSKTHDVTVAFTGKIAKPAPHLRAWLNMADASNVTIVQMPSASPPQLSGSAADSTAMAYTFDQWLRTQSFDVVHTSDDHGIAFYALLARRQGLAYANTHFVVHAAATFLSRLEYLSETLSSRTQVARLHVEQRVVELADTVISSSSKPLQLMIERGYTLNESACFVQPPLIDPFNDNDDDERNASATDIIGYFGPIDANYNLYMLCDAICRLPSTSYPKLKVSFVGPTVNKRKSKRMLKRLMKNSSLPWAIDFADGPDEGINLLVKPGTLAIVPARIGNGAYTLQSCLMGQVNVLALDDIQGLSGLISDEDDNRNLTCANIHQLTDALAKQLTPNPRSPRPSLSSQNNVSQWLEWHQGLTACEEKEGPATNSPLVSVCLVHHNRADTLDQALASLTKQTYLNFEVIIVDDGSTDPASLAELKRLETLYHDRGWRVVRQENLYLGAARNTAARHANGQYLLFMDDDNIAKPNEIETFVSAAGQTQADILTCFADVFSGDTPPTSSADTNRLTLLGDAVAFGMLANGFGDANAFVRKSTFDEIGGFTELWREGLDDQEFFARSVLQGYRMMIVPEALYWYRISKRRLRDLHYESDSGRLRVGRHYLNAVPPSLSPLLLYTIGLENKGKRAGLLMRLYAKALDFIGL